MKIDQLAFYAESDEEALRVKRLFGLQDAQWITDTVTADSSVYGSGLEENVAELQFNYDLGIELEILRYTKGPNWHDVFEMQRLSLPFKAFVSHIGIHLADEEEFPPMPGCNLVQETVTKHHTNEYVVEHNRTYHYKIFEFSPNNYIKFIKRMNHCAHGTLKSERCEECVEEGIFTHA